MNWTHIDQNLYIGQNLWENYIRREKHFADMKKSVKWISNW